MSDDNTAWIADRAAVTSFAGILLEADYLDTPRLVLDFMAKPWKWQPERDIWIELGQPAPETSDSSWNEFVERLAAL